MTDPGPARRYRFGAFEVDASTGELRRRGLRAKLNTQPFQILLLLLERPGELLTREEISKVLWPEGTFVDYEHGVNSAVNRLRESLGDSASNPRFIETLARRGYRFVAPVERVDSLEIQTVEEVDQKPPVEEPPPSPLETTPFRSRLLTSPEELPKTPRRVVRFLFVSLQLMYVGFYVGALANLGEIEELFSVLPKHAHALTLLIVTAAILIPVRAFLLTAALFRLPKGRENLLQLWPYLFPFDVLWALSPFLLLHHMSFGLALACTALLVYSPFAQRSLVLMGSVD